jgi:hypothetical protein
MGLDLQQAGFLGALEDACIKIGGEYFWKERKNIKKHVKILA